MPYRKMLISVGIFVTLIATLLVFSIGYIIQQQGVFEKKFHYKLFAKSGADLIEGMPILYSGFEIGVVTKLTLTDKGKVEVIIEIPQHEKRWLKEGSIFYLNKPLIGSATIIVESPHLENNELSEDKVQVLETKDGINELIEKVQPVLDNIQAIVSNVNYITRKESDLSKTMYNIEEITAKVSHTKAVTQLDAMLAEIRRSLTDPKEGIMYQVSELLEHVDSGILGDKNSSLSRINTILDDITVKLQKLNQTVDAVNDASGDIKGLSSDIKFTIKKTDEVINGLNGIVGSTPSGEVALP